MPGNVRFGRGRVARDSRTNTAGIALAGWMVLVVATFTVGAVWHPGYPTGWLPPFHAHFRVLTYSLLPAAAFGALAIIVVPRVAATLAWRGLLVITAVVNAVWAYLLALSAGRT